MLRAIEDILGSQLRIAPQNRRLEGYGSTVAQSAIALERGIRPEEAAQAVDPSWRRVDILIDGHVMLSLRAR